jgi:histidine triad (HIT) family protein
MMQPDLSGVAALDNCIFCKIVAKQIPSKTIYEDDDVIAFHDINPAAPVHFLIVPKQHVATLADCGEKEAALLGKMSLLAPRLAQEQGCGYQLDAAGARSGGFKTMFNTGPDGGQEVYHLHMHVIGGAHPWRVKFVQQ